jgi:hypothetical protein
MHLFPEFGVLHGQRRFPMINASEIREHADVVGADGLHVGTVDRVEGGRIKLTRNENDPGHQNHHHFISLSNVEAIEGGRIKLSVQGKDAIEEADGSAFH